MDYEDDIYDLSLLYEEQHADFTEDLAFHEQLAREAAGRVLELGVGSGRVALHCASRGFTVDGIDLNASMVERANQRAVEAGLRERFKAFQGDVRSLPAGQQYKLAIFPFNSICHLLTETDLQACLAAVYASLLPGGVFVPSLFLPDPLLFTRNPESLYPVADFYSESRQEHMVIYEQASHNPLTSLTTHSWFFDGDSTEETFNRSFTLRVWHIQELVDQLVRTGFTVKQLYGDYAFQAADAASVALSLRCVKDR